MNKFLIISIFFSIVCLVISGESLNSSQFSNAVGKEAGNTIVNSQQIIVKDIRGERIVPVTSEQLQSFKNFIMNDSSYIFDMKKRCLFVPQLSYEFKGSPNVTIYVSMICNQIKIVTDGEQTILDYDLIKNNFNDFNENIINHK